MMKVFLAALALCALGLAQAEVISTSPFHQHVTDFADQFKQLMSSNPTGEYKDVLRTAYKNFHQAKSALAASRPTGRPFRPHAERAQHNHATWALNKQWSKSKIALKKYFYDQAKLQKQNSDAADETEIISPFHQHVADFADQFKQFLSSKPSGTYREVFNKAYKNWQQASSALSASRPTGRPFRPHAERTQHNHATWALNRQWSQSRNDLRKYFYDQVKQAKLQKQNAGDETEILSSPFAAHPETFRQHFADLFANRPTGRPSFDQYKELLSQKYKEVKALLKAQEPKKKTAERKAYDEAKDQLKAHKNDVEDQLDQWKDDLKEQAVLNSVFGEHIAAFKAHFNQQFDMRPTGRPEIKGFRKALEKKYKEHKELLKNAKNGASDADRDLYDDAKDHLEDHFEDAMSKVKAWDQQLKFDQKAAAAAATVDDVADETEVLSSSKFSAHPESFRQHFADVFANRPRPTGRADLDQFESLLSQKYKEAKAMLKAQKPEKDTPERKEYEAAKDQLKDHKDDVEDKLDQWEDELEKQAVLNSVFGQHVSAFKTHFNQQFGMMPTGRPEIKGFMADLEKKYKEHKDLLKTVRQGQDKNLYEDAKDHLEDHFDDAKDKVRAWAKQVQAAKANEQQ